MSSRRQDKTSADPLPRRAVRAVAVTPRAAQAPRRIGVRDALRFIAMRIPELHHLALAEGDRARLTTVETEALKVALARVRPLGARASLLDELSSAVLYSRWEKPSRPQTAQGVGRPSKRGLRTAVRSVLEILERAQIDHAPKVAALLLWLFRVHLVDDRSGDTAARQLARATRAIEKCLRISRARR